MTHRRLLLEEGIKITCGDRDASYGEPINNFSNTAAIINAVMGLSLTASDVALIMVCVKMARMGQHASDDTYIDAAVYAAIVGELTAIENERTEQ